MQKVIIFFIVLKIKYIITIYSKKINNKVLIIL